MSEPEPDPLAVSAPADVDKPKSRVGPVLVLMAMFAFGGVAGAGLTRALTVRELSHKMEGPPSEARAKFRLEAMRRQLSLTDDQAGKVSQIMADAEARRDSAMSACRPDLDRTRELTSQQIMEVLSPEQQERYREMEQARRRDRDRGRGRPPK